MRAPLSVNSTPRCDVQLLHAALPPASGHRGVPFSGTKPIRCSSCWYDGREAPSSCPAAFCYLSAC